MCLVDTCLSQFTHDSEFLISKHSLCNVGLHIIADQRSPHFGFRMRRLRNPRVEGKGLGQRCGQPRIHQGQPRAVRGQCWSLELQSPQRGTSESQGPTPVSRVSTSAVKSPMTADIFQVKFQFSRRPTETPRASTDKAESDCTGCS